MRLSQRLTQLKRMDRLIQLKATGCAKAFARQLDISVATLYRYLEDLKDLDAPIEYDRTVQTYYYEKEYVLKFW